MAFSVLIGFPALRVQGPWLAFVTLAFNLLVFLVLNNEVGLTEGSRGLRALRTDLVVFGIDLFETRNYYYFCLRVPAGGHRAGVVDRAQPLGPGVQGAARQPRTGGQPRRRHPHLHPAGLLDRCRSRRRAPGALYARLIEYVEPRAFYIGQSFDFFLATVVGGLGTLVGPFIGTSFITVLADHLRFTGD